VHARQHCDEAIGQLFFDELKIPRPDVDRNAGSGKHAVQTAEVMNRFEPVALNR
jgi:UDP-N-acetylglucosamine 2-epimerase (non-hydrolysing)